MDWKESAEFRRLAEHVDPYSHLDRLAMPKYLINASGDEFFLPDSWQLYWNDLEGEKRIRHVPNTGHDILDTDAAVSLLSFYNRIMSNTPCPEFNWGVAVTPDEYPFPPYVPITAKSVGVLP